MAITVTSMHWVRPAAVDAVSGLAAGLVPRLEYETGRSMVSAGFGLVSTEQGKHLVMIDAGTEAATGAYLQNECQDDLLARGH